MKKYQRGQVLLISLLVLTVALTVGLSVAVRTINTNRMASAADSSQRAFSAAEAGIEKTLTTGIDSGTPVSLSNNSSFTTSTSTLSGDEFLANGGSFVLKDEPFDVWLSHYSDYTSPWTGDLTIYWGSSSDVCNLTETNDNMAAIEVILITGPNAANASITHYAFDPCDARASVNKFCKASAGCGITTGGSYSVKGKNFSNKAAIRVNSGLLARIIPLYGKTVIGIKNTTSVNPTPLPAQGTRVESIGDSGGTRRKIVTFRGYPKAPIELFPYLMFAPN